MGDNTADACLRARRSRPVREGGTGDGPHETRVRNKTVRERAALRFDRPLRPARGNGAFRSRSKPSAEPGDRRPRARPGRRRWTCPLHSRLRHAAASRDGQGQRPPAGGHSQPRPADGASDARYPAGGPFSSRRATGRRRVAVAAGLHPRLLRLAARRPCWPGPHRHPGALRSRGRPTDQGQGDVRVPTQRAGQRPGPGQRDGRHRPHAVPHGGRRRSDGDPHRARLRVRPAPGDRARSVAVRAAGSRPRRAGPYAGLLRGRVQAGKTVRGRVHDVRFASHRRRVRGDPGHGVVPQVRAGVPRQSMRRVAPVRLRLRGVAIGPILAPSALPRPLRG